MHERVEIRFEPILHPKAYRQASDATVHLDDLTVLISKNRTEMEAATRNGLSIGKFMNDMNRLLRPPVHPEGKEAPKKGDTDAYQEALKKHLKASRDIARRMEVKTDRITKGMRENHLFGHIAYRVKLNTSGRVTIRTPIGYILSHTVAQHPTDKHVTEFNEAFPEADSQHRMAHSAKLLHGEYAYVIPEERKQRPETLDELHDAHEQEAAQLQYTHRMAYAWEKGSAEHQDLLKQGYIEIAIRPTGTVVLAKRLTSAP